MKKQTAKVSLGKDLKKEIELEMTVRRVRLDLIDRDPDQPRKRFDALKITELSESLKRTKGTIQMIVIRPHPKKRDRFMMVAGERRWLGLQKAGAETTTARIYKGDLPSYVVSAVENKNRVDLNPMEEAWMIRRLHEEFNYDWQEIAFLLGCSLATVYARLKLLGLPEEVQTMILEEKLPPVSALNLSQFHGSKGKLLRLAHDLVAGRVPPELAEAKSKFSEGHIRGKLPTTPEGLVRRILEKTVYKAPSAVIAIDSFFGLTKQEQKAAILELPIGVRENARVQLRSFGQRIGRVLELLEDPALK